MTTTAPQHAASTKAMQTQTMKTAEMLPPLRAGDPAADGEPPFYQLR
jgi:hypothetical protein